MAKNFFDKIRPTFSEGGKLSWLHSSFDAFETFFFVPNRVTKKGGVHVKDCVDLKRILIIVVLSLVPALLFGIWNLGEQHSIVFGLGWGFWEKVWYGFVKIIPLYLVSYIVGLGIEFASAQMKGHEVSEGYLVSGFIIPLIVPVDVPWWMLTLAVAFAVIIGKEVFGGTGMNIWNPALLARAFLFFSYPSKMSGDSVWVGGLSKALEGGTPWKGGEVVDALSGATPLSHASLDGLSQAGTSVLDLFVGNIPGAVGETSVIAILIGAFILLCTGVASWKTMLSVFVGGALTAALFHSTGLSELTWYEHLFLGGFCFGAVFMATDPVTSARTETGKYFYGLLIGVVAILIRVLNPGYPEGMMLAILLMNIFAALFDYLVVDRNIRRRAKRVLNK